MSLKDAFAALAAYDKQEVSMVREEKQHSYPTGDVYSYTSLRPTQKTEELFNEMAQKIEKYGTGLSVAWAGTRHVNHVNENHISVRIDEDKNSGKFYLRLPELDECEPAAA